MHRLVAALRPPVVVGEQVASRAGLDWLDGVCADLEAAGYATGAIDLCAASVGAPHIRQRLWWVAYAPGAGPQGSGSGWGPRQGREGGAAERGGEAGWMGDADNGRSQGGGDTGGSQGLGLEGPQSARADTDGFWSAADWIPCRDSKARPVEPGTFPLVDRAPARVGRLRAYGNAIVPPLAAQVLIATSELVANRLKPVANGGTDGR
jgi:DNA (cytosine-5)-methyltransferase 1